MIKLEDAITVLRKFNEWRRYDGPLGEGPIMPEPAIIGAAIDKVCEVYAERQKSKKNE